MRRKLLACLALIAMAGLAHAKMPVPAPGQGMLKVEGSAEDWFSTAKSEFGFCCAEADGYRQGITYLVPDGHEKVPIVVFVSATKVPGGFDVTVWDTGDHAYKTVFAGENTRVEGNPTGKNIVWLYQLDGSVAVRCFSPAVGT